MKEITDEALQSLLNVLRASPFVSLSPEPRTDTTRADWIKSCQIGLAKASEVSVRNSDDESLHELYCHFVDELGCEPEGTVHHFVDEFNSAVTSEL